MPRFVARFACLLLLLTLALAGCRPQVTAPGDPVAAVHGLAQAVRDNDLVRYSRLSVPPALHERMQARWSAKLAAAAPPTAAQQRDYARWMERLTGPEAETRLYASFDGKIRKLEAEIGSQWPLMQATGGIFVNGLIQANGKLTPSEKAHAKAVGTTLLDWLSPALMTDRARARQAIAIVCRTARGLELPTLADSRRLEMIPALEKGGQLLKGLKQVGRVYGLDADAALAGVSARVLSADNAVATMEVSYPLLEETVTFQMELVRRDGRWYSQDAVRSAEAELLQPLVATARAAP